MTQELQLLHEGVRADLERGDFAAAAARLTDLSPALVADLFEILDAEECIELVRRMNPEDAAEVLAEVDDRSLGDVLELLRDGEIVDLLDNLPSDDAADMVGQLEQEDQDRVIEMLDRVDHQDAVELKELLRYPEDSAGGVMAKEYLSIREDAPIGGVRESLKALDEDELASMHFVYVVDARDRLLGRIPLIKLLLSDDALLARDVMDDDIQSARTSDDQEHVANLFLRHDLVSLPIVDDSGRLVGRVTVDDAMDVLTEEATEDVARLAGSSAEEVGETSVFRISRARLPWLVLGLLGECVAAFVLSHFEESLSSKVILAFFIPLVIATGGNTGIQTSSIVIRMLITQDLGRHRAGRHLLRELTVGLLNGLILGAIMALLLLGWKQDPTLGLIIGISLMSVVLLATFVGSMVPLFLNRVGVDPTVATGPFITTSNDVIGLAVYMGIAHWLLTVF